MKLPDPFRWEHEHIAGDLPGARVLFTTRRGGVSRGPFASLNLGLWTGDDPADVLENRQRVAGLAGLPRERLAQGRQVHAADVRRLAHPPPAGEPEPADGQATSARDVAAIVLTADCLPVAVVGDGAVAMLHAGWRGLAAGVLEEGVAALRELGARGPLTAAIGPGAGGCCYQAGKEVHAAFAELGADVSRGANVDLALIARRRLEACGVEDVHDVGICTICTDPELFFSHRRDAGVTGRQAGVVRMIDG